MGEGLVSFFGGVGVGDGVERWRKVEERVILRRVDLTRLFSGSSKSCGVKEKRWFFFLFNLL